MVSKALVGKHMGAQGSLLLSAEQAKVLGGHNSGAILDGALVAYQVGKSSRGCREQ